MERGETAVGQGGAGAPLRVFASPAQPESESMLVTFAAVVQVETIVCVCHGENRDANGMST